MVLLCDMVDRGTLIQPFQTPDLRALLHSGNLLQSQEVMLMWIDGCAATITLNKGRVRTNTPVSIHED